MNDREEMEYEENARLDYIRELQIEHEDHYMEPGPVGARLEEVAAVRRFVEGDHGIFTLKSRKTGKHFTFQRWNRGDFCGISFLRGPDNGSDYTYLGKLWWRDGGPIKLYLTAKSQVTELAPVYQALDYFLRALNAGVVPEALEFWHSGHCCRCGRLLTTPESVASGIGPTCAGKA